MLNKTLWFSLIVSLASVALAQDKVDLGTKTVEAISPQATQDCEVTYNTGTFHTGTQFCVTVNGNIPMFAVRGAELFAPAGNSGDLEGYGFCDATASQRYYDYAAYDNDSWNASTLKQSGNTVTVTRTTKDGNWQLTQIIVNVPATATAVGSAKVTMKLKNLTKVARSAILIRYAAEAVPGGNNTYHATQLSATGQWEFLAGLMIAITSFPPDLGSEAYVQNIQSGPDPCNPLANADTTLPYVGLGSIVAAWDTKSSKIAPGGVATVTSTYRPF